MRVHVPVNLRFTPRHSGDWTSFVEILRALGEEPGGNEFTVTFNDDPAGFPVRAGGALEFRALAPRGWPWNTLRYQPWLQFLYPRSIRGGADRGRVAGLFLDAKLPLAWRGPTVVRVQDLAFHRFADCFKARDLVRLRAEILSVVRRADRLVAISGATRDDLVRIYDVPPERIHVAPNGVAEVFRRLPEEERGVAVSAAMRRLGLGRPYVLTVGVLQRRKNLLRLLQAWELLRSRHDPGCDLVLAGARGWLIDDLLAFHASMARGAEVKLVGPVPEADLVALYNGARAFVLPSLYEGFGIPLAEAMACGAPCLAARASSLPEVGGDAVDYFDPTSVEDIARSLAGLLGDDARRARLSQAGPERAARFTWRAAARVLNAALAEVADA